MRPLIGLSCLALALAADEGSKHYHGGKLSRYEIGPPALLLSESDEARLRSGELDPQDAFLAGSIPIEGDEGLAIGLALAAMSPE